MGLRNERTASHDQDDEVPKLLYGQVAFRSLRDGITEVQDR
jgi:hypothetical protein